MQGTCSVCLVQGTCRRMQQGCKHSRQGRFEFKVLESQLNGSCLGLVAAGQITIHPRPFSLRKKKNFDSCDRCHKSCTHSFSAHCLFLISAERFSIAPAQFCQDLLGECYRFPDINFCTVWSMPISFILHSCFQWHFSPSLTIWLHCWTQRPNSNRGPRIASFRTLFFKIWKGLE